MNVRLAFFTPDPFTEQRFTLGALVGTEQVATFTPTEHLPGPDCLGGHAPWLTLQLVLESLSSLSRLDPELGFASQLLTFSERVLVPDGCPDAIEWVRRSLLPRAPASRRLSFAS